MHTHNLLEDVLPKQVLMLHGGKVQNLHGLSTKLSLLDKKEYATSHTNIVEWIFHVVKLPALAEKISGIRDPLKAQASINDYIEHHEESYFHHAMPNGSELLQTELKPFLIGLVVGVVLTLLVL